MDANCLTSTAEIDARRARSRLDACILQIAAGDQEALSTLYELTRGAVYGFALSILKNTQDAEDVLQDSYLRICSAAGDYRAEGKPMAWIFSIVRNLALMRLREGKRLAGLPEEEQDNPQMTGEDRVVLRAFLEALPETERQIVLLHAAAGFRHWEIAKFLHMPLSTVLSKYHRAMKRLRVQIAEDMI